MRTLWTALLCGCGIEPFETPSAYDQQRYLCEEPELLEDAANACREEREPCAGFISFQGQIQRVQLRVDTQLQRGIVRVTQSGGAHPAQNLSRVELSGAAPYFHFDVAISSIGAPWSDQPTSPDFTLTYDTPSPATALDFDDGFGAVQWYIRAGSDTAMLTSNPKKGTIDVALVSEERVDLAFEGGLGPVDDTLDACAIVFPESIDIVPIP
jgi:hypothetical protein